MKTIPVYFLWIFLFGFVTFTLAQTDFNPFISSPNKFTSRSFSQPEAASGTRAEIPSGRRNAFFPPPDRLSRTVRPILYNQGGGVSSTTTSKPVVSRFHPSASSKFTTTSVDKTDKNKKGDDYEEVYYEYYYDDEDNGTTTTTTNTPLAALVALNNKFSQNPTGFSKFHSGNFRTREDVPKKETTPPPIQRFRFATVDNVERVTRPTVLASTANRMGSLADLLAQLKSNINQNENPSSNFVDSNRESKQYVRPRESVQSLRNKENDPSDFKYRTTNSTESTFSTGSVISSHSIKDKTISSSIKSLTTTEIPYQTTHYITDDATNIFDAQSTELPQSNKNKGKILEDLTAGEYLEHISEPEGPPTTNSFSSLFENIHIAVDPSLLPPGYSVEETVTETTPKESRLPNKSKTVTPDTSKSTIESFFSTLPQEDITSFLPPGYSSTITTESIIQKESEGDVPQEKEKSKSTKEDAKIEGKLVDPASFLPPGFTPEKESEAEEELPGVLVKNIDVSAFLPPGYKPQDDKKETETVTEEPLPGVPVKNVDVNAFLPSGFSASENEENDPLPGVEIKTIDVSKFLPPGFNSKVDSNNGTSTEETTRKGHAGIVFPRRPKRPEYLITTTTTSKPQISGPPPLKPKLQNLFDRVKALGTTEYHVPVITEKSKPAESADIKESTTVSTTTTTTTTTTTVPTTTTPPRPTTPGLCGSKCRLAASLRLTAGTEWHPELANRDTLEFQELANVIEYELDSFFRSSSISLWYEFVEVDSFNKGSVIVSYILSLSHIEADIDTKDLKERLNTDLERVAHSLGNFTVDPAGTDFIVIPEQQIYVPDDSQNFLIPEWLIAVIVIGLASFLFILIFGVVALVSRARVRKRANVPLTEEFLNNLNALQVNGIDNYAMNGLYDMDPVWNEKFQEKAMKPPSSHGKGYNPEYNVNIYDSWRTDYSGPYTSSSANQSKRRTELDFDGKQFYKDDPYDF